jgi:ADP-dependent NAD(P)H-hydrate dehydratase
LVGAHAGVLLDAFALGALPSLGEDFRPADKLVLTPNPAEAGLLLGHDLENLEDDVASIAARYRATVSCQGVIAAPDGRRWLAGTGQGGLGTSGSGDVLAGAIGGLLARGADPAQAACWGTYLHAAAGDRLNARVGPTGYLAREILPELAVVLAELGQQA